MILREPRSLCDASNSSLFSGFVVCTVAVLQFHYLPSLGLGVGSNIDNTGRSTSAYVSGEAQYHFIDSPLLSHRVPTGMTPGTNTEHAVNTAGGGRWIHPVHGVAGSAQQQQHLAAAAVGGAGATGGAAGGSSSSRSDSPGVASSPSNPSSTSASPASATHTLFQNVLRGTTGGGGAAGTGSLVGSNTGSPGVSSSPGVGVRRLAEQFLNSITDDSPAVRPRRIGLGKGSSVVTPSVHVPTTATDLKRGSESSSMPHAVPEEDVAAAGKEQEGGKGAGADETSSQSSSAQAVSPSTAGSTVSPSSAASSAAHDDWQQLHADILKFSDSCAADSAAQKRLRDELVQRTQWSIRCVWPTAQVDLVGSVAAGVCLPKSDLDFVIRFPPSATPPPSYSYATATQNSAAQQQQGQGQGQQGQPGHPHGGSGQGAGSAGIISAPIPSTYTAGGAGGASPGDAPPSSSSPGPLLQHFASASTLIKLIGGRKKSKLLFRSTKIQVFKDVRTDTNTIRAGASHRRLLAFGSLSLRPCDLSFCR